MSLLNIPCLCYRMAFKYLGMAFFPLAFCYCIYRFI